MKKALSILLAFTLLFLSTACTQKTARDESSDDEGLINSSESVSDEGLAESSSDLAESDVEAQKPWLYKPLKTLRNQFNSGLLNESVYRVLSKGDPDGFVSSICDKGGEYLNVEIVRGYSNMVNVYESIFEYLPDGVLEYRVELVDENNDEYAVYIGLMPMQFHRMSAEEFIKSATDYYELFEMKSGSVVSGNNEINYVYREFDKGTNAFSLAVLYEKWFVLILPSDIESRTAKTPWLLFDKIVYEKRSYDDQSIDDMISCAIKTNEYTIVERYKDSVTYRYTVYSDTGDVVSEFETVHFYPLRTDATKRICLRLQNVEGNPIYCNALGEELLMNNAEYLMLFDDEKGEYIGIENGKAYIYDGDDNKREYGRDYEVLKTLGKTKAVKLNDSIYGLLQNGLFVRLYETDFSHESAALEYNEEYDAVFVGGDAITEIVNRYGEIVEAYWYDCFEADISGKYILTSDRMSLFGNIYILDALTFKPIADLPNCADYEFLWNGKLLVYYRDHENNDEYVEFQVEIEDAIRNYPYYEDSDDCDCFNGYPTEEDFK